jgi:hypothetical protein
VDERRDRLGLALEVLGLAAGQVGVQHLDGRLLIESQVLAQVDLGIAALAQQAHQPVVAEVLSGAICHVLLLN